MVVVRPSTGEVLAVANGGDDTGFNRAFEGRYPPGSTFKVVSTEALLAAGLSPDETVPCPAGANVGGRTFVNAEAHELGSVPFRVDFAESCNTAFVGLADRVTDAQLAESAAALGLTDDYALGVPSFGGDVPANDDAVGHAAAMIGQSRVLASPLGLSVVAASVAEGATVTPVLVTDPLTGARLLPDETDTDTDTDTDTEEAAPSSTPTSVPAPAAQGRSLDPAVAATLQELMGEVVTSGTGTVLAGVPGPPVHAKTGTAEYGTEVPPRTHAWMIGYQGDLAFAVLVEDGGFGAQAAGPVVEQFLRSVG
jgi:cell division protein FtsI/penicillin-binding protein 2